MHCAKNLDRIIFCENAQKIMKIIKKYCNMLKDRVICELENVNTLFKFVAYTWGELYKD